MLNRGSRSYDEAEKGLGYASATRRSFKRHRPIFYSWKKDLCRGFVSRGRLKGPLKDAYLRHVTSNQCHAKTHLKDIPRIYGWVPTVASELGNRARSLTIAKR